MILFAPWVFDGKTSLVLVERGDKSQMSGLQRLASPGGPGGMFRALDGSEIHTDGVRTYMQTP